MEIKIRSAVAPLLVLCLCVGLGEPGGRACERNASAARHGLLWH